jgi:uncharacterized protein YihD (DUF1040 family)
MLYNLYRISDASRVKEKIAGATKINCLKNFISVFGTDGLFVFADNCTNGTVNQIKELGIEPVLISLGNSASFRYIVDFALASFTESDHVYLIEDDYWHLPTAKQALIEGLQIADYVTLYDHPDKYIGFEIGGSNPYIKHNGEKSRVFLSQTSHWKTSNSTTMTFATRIAELKADKHLMMKYTEQKIPQDFELFLFLTKQSPGPLFRRNYYKLFFQTLLYYLKLKKRVLITALPGLSTHIEHDQLTPHIHWESIIQNADQKPG